MVEIKTFDERKKEAQRLASLGLKEIEKAGMLFPKETPKLEDILNHTQDYIKTSVKSIANIVASIKDVGLDIYDLAVTNWVEKTLEVTPQEFDKFLNNIDSGEEAKIRILEEMEVPKSIIEEVKNETRKSKKKK